MNSSRWQFSTRSLLVLTALVSVVLAFAVKMPAVFQVMLLLAALVLVVVAIFQTANFATSDNRPRLAVVAWLLLTSFFVIYCAGIAMSLTLRAPTSVTPGWLSLFGVMATCAVLSVYRACRSFRQIGCQHAPERHDSTDNASS